MDALRREGVPFVSVLADPTYGGVSASYAMQADVRVAVGSARIGFAGPAVILNTMFEMDQSKFDEACPENFQVRLSRHLIPQDPIRTDGGADWPRGPAWLERTCVDTNKPRPSRTDTPPTTSDMTAVASINRL